MKSPVASLYRSMLLLFSLMTYRSADAQGTKPIITIPTRVVRSRCRFRTRSLHGERQSRFSSLAGIPISDFQRNMVDLLIQAVCGRMKNPRTGRADQGRPGVVGPVGRVRDGMAPPAISHGRTYQSVHHGPGPTVTGTLPVMPLTVSVPVSV